METRNCKHCETEFQTNYPVVIRNPDGSVMWEGRKNLLFCDSCIAQGKGGMPIEIPTGPSLSERRNYGEHH